METLKSQLKENRTSHTYIFQSNDLELAKTKAYDFIKELMPDDELEKSMQRDLMVLEASGKTIKIESVREMIKFFQSKPFHSEFKFALIEDGAKLNVQSSNAMLKILEELPSYGKIIILAQNAYELLPTIRSRCQHVNIEARVSYDIDVEFVEGLVEAFLYKDLGVIVRNKEKIENLKDKGEEFFSVAIDHLTRLRLNENNFDDIIIEKSIDRAIEVSSNLNNNVNFLLSVEYFALGFIE